MRGIKQPRFFMLIGDYRFEIVSDTEFRLDGGAMFGVVPRALWERVAPPDELNRIKLNAHCLFVDTGKEKILIETGIGEKWSESETEIYGIFRDRSFAESLLAATGCRPADITIVVNTHLHFDHAGGNTILPPASTETFAARGEAAAVQPQFPNARYLVSRSELEHAENPHERDRASYLGENWRPIIAAGQLEAMPDSSEVVAGLTIEQTRGHSETMQTWRLDRGGRTVFGFADLIPTRHHLSAAWIMSYDLYPVETLSFKKQILPRAAVQDWICLFYHDFEMPLCRIRQINGKFCPESFETF